MSATAAVPDKSIPVNDTASASTTDLPAELNSWYAEHDGDEVVTAPTPAPAASTTTATETEPEQTATTATATTSTADTPVPAPVLSEDAFWNASDNNPKLPKHLQGKSRREVYEANVGSLWEAMQAGQQKNNAERELRVTQTLLDVARQQLQQSAQSATATPAAPAPVPGHKVFGLESAESAFGKVDQVVDQLPGYVQQQIQQQATEIAKTMVAPLAQTVEQIQQQAVRDQQQAVIKDAEAARFSVRDKLKIDPDVYERITPSLKSYLYLNQLDPRVPQNWEAAALDYKSNAARLVPQTAAIPTPAPPVGSATAAAVPPTGTKRPISTGDRKADAMIGNQLTTLFGYTKGTARYDAAFKSAVELYRTERGSADE